MSAPGLIWMPGGGSILSPAWLNAGLIEDLGSHMQACWIVDDATFVAGSATSLPSRNGPTQLPLFGSTGLVREMSGGRTGFSNDSAAVPRALGATTAYLPQVVWSVAQSTEIPIAAAYNVLVRGNPFIDDSTWLVAQDVGFSTWYASWGAKYRDGVLTFAIDTNWHIYQSKYPANTDVGITIFGYPHLAFGGWIGNAKFFMHTDGGESAAQESAARSRLRTYYSGLGLP
jgi:hypothetical protein